MAKQNYYELLGLSPSVSADQIKAAYRQLARKYHPDVNPGDQKAESLFKQVGEAYATLSDPVKRAMYHQNLGLGSTAPQKTPPPKESSAQAKVKTKSPPPQNTTHKASPKKETAGIDLQGTQFKDMFDTLFRKPEKEAPKKESPSEHSARRPQEKPRRGEDITVDLWLRPSDTETGVVKTVSIRHVETCKRCSGMGRVNGLICPVCQGSKEVESQRKIDVKVPAGVKSGAKIRLAKEGGRGLHGGEHGDLFLLIRLEPPSHLKIDGLTVTCELPISIPEAVLGAEIEVPTLQGSVKMTIPPQTSSGKVFRLKGQGLSANGSTGDQFVTVYIVAPTDLSPQEKALYQELRRLQK